MQTEAKRVVKKKEVRGARRRPRRGSKKKTPEAPSGGKTKSAVSRAPRSSITVRDSRTPKVTRLTNDGWPYSTRVGFLSRQQKCMSN